MPDAEAVTQVDEARLAAIAPDFEISTVCLRSELEFENWLDKAPDLRKRYLDFCKAVAEAATAERLSLLTGCYHVDPVLTPRLHKLGQALTNALRLVQPLDVYVRNAWEQNAFCLPTRKGRRLIMCLNSALVERLAPRELLYAMGHEAGHAILGHGLWAIGAVDFDNPSFSPLEVLSFWAWHRRRELTCDRIGLLACQNLRAACSALFKLVSGLSEQWVLFDEGRYAEQLAVLDEKEGDGMDLRQESATHPLVPLRVKALMEFARSEPFARAFGRTQFELAAPELEKRVQYMLSMLDADLSEWQGQDELKALNRFLFNAALLLVGADGIVQPSEVAWLTAHFKGFHPDQSQDLEARILDPRFRGQLMSGLTEDAPILQTKLTGVQRAGLVRVLITLAQAAGAVVESESEFLETLRQMLAVPAELVRAGVQQG